MLNICGGDVTDNPQLFHGRLADWILKPFFSINAIESVNAFVDLAGHFRPNLGERNCENLSPIDALQPLAFPPLLPHNLESLL